MHRLKIIVQHVGSAQPRNSVPVHSSFTSASQGRLENRAVVVFGGSSGIGLGIARRCVLEGAKVTVVGRDLEKLRCVTTELGGNVAAASVELQNEAAVAAFFAGLRDRSIDCIINTAGASAFLGNLIANQRTCADLRRQLDLKLLVQLAPVLHGSSKLRDGASVVLTSGVLAQRPGKGNTGLAIANAAIETAVKGLAHDLGASPRCIRINAISPGLVKTPFFDKMEPAKRDAYFSKAEAQSPIGKIGSVDEIADCVLMLLTNTFMTGQTVVCDGGHLVKE